MNCKNLNVSKVFPDFFILHIVRIWLVKFRSRVKITFKSEEKSVLHVTYFTISKQIVPEQTKAHFQIFF